jgi:hypothetical protein
MPKWSKRNALKNDASKKQGDDVKRSYIFYNV